jgi:hypothetical protein
MLCPHAQPVLACMSLHSVGAMCCEHIHILYSNVHVPNCHRGKVSVTVASSAGGYTLCCHPGSPWELSCTTQYLTVALWPRCNTYYQTMKFAQQGVLDVYSTTCMLCQWSCVAQVQHPFFVRLTQPAALHKDVSILNHASLNWVMSGCVAHSWCESACETPRS